MPKKRVSIKDIAAVAGVSHPTVSRALRGQGRMSDETRARIIATAQEMGYTPNLVARGLVMQRTNSIGLIVTNIADPFHSDVIRGVESVVSAREFSLFLGSTTANPKQELQVVRSFLGRNVDGIIISASQVGDRYTDLQEELDVPIVLINSHAEGSNIHSVTHDDFSGAAQVMDHLLAQGFRRIAFVGYPQGGRANRERQRAWRQRLRDAGLNGFVAVDASQPQPREGMNAVLALLEQAQAVWQAPPDALFCYNDLLAIGALTGLRAQGYLVPDDVAIAGFDDLEVVSHLRPALTTLRQPRFEMGVRAAEMLLELIVSSAEGGEEIPPETHFLGALQVRASTRPRQ